MNKVQLNNTAISLSTDLLDALKHKDIGLMQFNVAKNILSLVRESTREEYGLICDRALPHTSRWPVFKTRSAVSFYCHEIVVSVTSGRLTIVMLEKILLELSIALKFNGFRVAKRAEQHNLTYVQIKKLLEVNQYE